MRPRAIGATVRLMWRVGATPVVLASLACAAGNPAQVAHAQEAIEIPAEGATVTLPVHVLAQVGEPGQRVRIVLRWQNGIELSRASDVLNADGRGLLVTNLDWDHGTRRQLPDSQAATLQIVSDAGRVLGRREITVLGPNNPQLREVALYWLGGDSLKPVPRRIARTPRIATATIEELLWGPGPADPPGLLTALPTPRDVLEYPGRRSDWGPRVQLRLIRIVDGVATADFSRELGAYGGGSFRVGMIDQMITRTLEQFPTVRDVRVAIDGETGGVLEP
jgi:hypothetical protein